MQCSEIKSKRLLLRLLVVAVLHCVCIAGKQCQPLLQCCRDDETCCKKGCCPSGHSVCCPLGCCPSNDSVCCSDGNCCTSDSPICCSDGSGCCPSDHSVCCPGGSCCPSDFPVCCSTKCCQSGAHCCAQGCCLTIGSSVRGAPIFYSAKAKHVDLARPVAEKLTIHTAEAVHVHAAQVVRHSISSSHSKVSGPCNSYEREQLNEGYCHHVYKDNLRHIPTIGVGFNLLKEGAQKQIESVGANYNAVLNGSQNLTDTQIKEL